jgi:hypothetical protein
VVIAEELAPPVVMGLLQSQYCRPNNTRAAQPYDMLSKRLAQLRPGIIGIDPQAWLTDILGLIGRGAATTAAVGRWRPRLLGPHVNREATVGLAAAFSNHSRALP